MENKETSVIKHTMKFGALIGSALIFFSVLLFIFGINQNQYQFPGYLIMAVGIIMGIKQYRDAILNGFITYKHSLKIGTFIGLFSAFIFNFYIYIFYKYIDPSQLDIIIEQVKTQMSQGRSEEEVDMAMQIMDKLFSPGWMFISGLFGYTFVGFLFSLIISIFLKKENLMSDTQQNSLWKFL